MKNSFGGMFCIVAMVLNAASAASILRPWQKQSFNHKVASKSSGYPVLRGLKDTSEDIVLDLRWGASHDDSHVRLAKIKWEILYGNLGSTNECMASRVAATFRNSYKYHYSQFVALGSESSADHKS